MVIFSPKPHPINFWETFSKVESHPFPRPSTFFDKKDQWSERSGVTYLQFYNTVLVSARRCLSLTPLSEIVAHIVRINFCRARDSADNLPRSWKSDWRRPLLFPGTGSHLGGWGWGRGCDTDLGSNSIIYSASPSTFQTMSRCPLGQFQLRAHWTQPVVSWNNNFRRARQCNPKVPYREIIRT